MKKIRYMMMAVILIFVLSACEGGTVLNKLDITIDLDTYEVSADSDFVMASFDLESRTLTIDLDASITLSSDFELTINGIKFDQSAYETNAKTVTLTLVSLDDINPDIYIDVDVTFHLNGGTLTKSDFEKVIPDYEMTIQSKNDGSGDTLTLVDNEALALRFSHKIFIVYDEAYDAYRVVGVDQATTSVEYIDIEPYDYIIAMHQYYPNETLLNQFIGYTSESKTLAFTLFDQDLDAYDGGDLVASFYTSDIVSDTFVQTFKEPSQLPTPIRAEYIFDGWYLGDVKIETYAGFTNLNPTESFTLVARWSDYTMSDLNRYLNDLMPDEVYDHIELPETYSSFQLVWSSSDPSIIDSTGHFQRPYQGQTVTLTVDISNDLITDQKHFDVVAIGYKSLDKPIASSYIYRAYDEVDDNFFETLDIINTAFITADSQGNLSGENYLYNVQTYIMSEAKKRGNWVIMTIGPGSSWSEIASSPTRIETFANNIIDMINTYGFDGVDIDWETPASTEMTRFTAMMKVIYEKVKENNPNHLVTAAIGGGMWQPPKYDLTHSKVYLDYINLMTYGMTSGSGQYQNPLYKSSTYDNPSALVGRTLSSTSIDESVQFFRDNYGVTYDQIIVGLAFYGIKQVRTYDSGSGTYTAWVREGSVYYHEIYNSYLNNNAYTEYYDTNAGVPYLLNDQKTAFISYDNPKSILEKSRYILDNELAGLMFWEYGTDTSGVLLQALRTGLEK